jgi:hypothetical protein
MKERVLWPILHEARTLATNGTNFDADKFHNKFAELIVRECAHRSKELGQPEIGKGLMKHFGVEE